MEHTRGSNADGRSPGGALRDEFLAERLPRNALTMVDAGHFVWEETPGEYASIVTAWVDRRSSCARAPARPSPPAAAGG